MTPSKLNHLHSAIDAATPVRFTVEYAAPGSTRENRAASPEQVALTRAFFLKKRVTLFGHRSDDKLSIK